MTSSKDDDALEARRKALAAKVSSAKAEIAPQKPPPQADYSALGLAMRLGAEFVAGVIAGGAIGWGLDQLLGTTPFGMVIFLLVGFAAGIMNMVRAGRAAETQMGENRRDS